MFLVSVLTSLFGSLRSGGKRNILNLPISQSVAEKKNKSRRLWPLGLLATGLAGTAVMLFRGCWHGKMSWPIRIQEHSYQVCLGCGIKRLFDEKGFRAYGPYSYDLNRLVSWDLAQRQAAIEVSEPEIASEVSKEAPLEIPRQEEPTEHRSAS
jgi:hypothetical protein